MKTVFHLTNKKILITGASSGIGRQAAISCAEMDAQLILTGRNIARLEETKQLVKKDCEIIAGDLLEEEAVKTLAHNVEALDGIVHAAGIVKPFPIPFLNKKKIDETMQPNFYVAALLTTELFKAKKIRNNASLIFLSSISAQFPGKANSMYAASKAAIEAFSKTVAAEYAHKKIRSNCISPAMVKTPMYDYSSEGMFEEMMNKHIAKYPLGIGEPEDIANAIVFLLSPASKWITGINIIMDGGFLVSG